MAATEEIGGITLGAGESWVRFLAGDKGPEGKSTANLTPTGLKKLDDHDLREFLLSGLSPDGDVTAKAMGEVVANTTSQLTPSDLAALIAYLRSLAALPNEAK